MVNMNAYDLFIVYSHHNVLCTYMYIVETHI